MSMKSLSVEYYSVSCETAKVYKRASGFKSLARSRVVFLLMSLAIHWLAGSLALAFAFPLIPGALFRGDLTAALPVMAVALIIKWALYMVAYMLIILIAICYYALGFAGQEEGFVRRVTRLESLLSAPWPILVLFVSLPATALSLALISYLKPDLVAFVNLSALILSSLLLCAVELFSRLLWSQRLREEA